MNSTDKLTSLVKSRRFWISVAGVAAVVLNETFGISDQEVFEVAGIVIAWVIGDSLRKTQ